MRGAAPPACAPATERRPLVAGERRAVGDPHFAVLRTRMAAPPQPGSTSVVLVAERTRDAWRAALERAGCIVRTPSWLDAITAARTYGPHVVVVSGDLPDNALPVLVQTLRSSDLHDLPVLVAGITEELADSEIEPLFQPDRVVAPPVDPEALAAEVLALARSGRLAPRPSRISSVLGGLSLLLVGALLLGTGFPPLLRRLPFLEGPWPFIIAAVLLLATGAAASARGRRRAPSVWTLRTGVGWTGLLLFQGAMRFPGREGWPGALTASAAFLAFAAWAWLGQRVKRRSFGRGGLRLLSALCGAAAGIPWILLALR